VGNKNLGQFVAVEGQAVIAGGEHSLYLNVGVEYFARDTVRQSEAGKSVLVAGGPPVCIYAIHLPVVGVDAFRRAKGVVVIHKRCFVGVKCHVTGAFHKDAFHLSSRRKTIKYLLNIEMEVSRQLYMNPGTEPTIDRAQPDDGGSELFQWDNKCSALDAEWQCLPYARTTCERLRGTEEYLGCVDEHFHACRRGAGCDYRYASSPTTCTGPNLTLDDAVRVVCNDPSKEYASVRSYEACVDRMREWTRAGCVNLSPNEVAGAVVGSTGW